MLMVQGKPEQMSTGLGRMFGEATLVLIDELDADPRFLTNVAILNSASREAQRTLLLHSAIEAVGTRVPTEFPTIWSDVAVVAVFGLIADVIQDRLPGHVPHRLPWRRTVERNARRFQFGRSRIGLGEQILLARKRFLTANWESEDISEGVDRAPRTMWAPKPVANHPLPSAFWDVDPPRDALERQSELRRELERLVHEQSAPRVNHPANMPSEPRLARRVRI